jgi:hypothetical protein
VFETAGKSKGMSDAIVPAGAGVSPSLSDSPKSRLVAAIRGWVHMDNLAESHQRQAMNARAVRAKHEAEAIGLMRQLGLTKSKIQVSGAELHLASHRTVAPLSWKYLEREVPAWLASARLPPDHAKSLLKWLQEHREYRESEELEKTVAAGSGAGTPLKPRGTLSE